MNTVIDTNTPTVTHTDTHTGTCTDANLSISPTTCLPLPQLVYFVIGILFFRGGREFDTDTHIAPTSRPVTAPDTGGCVLDSDSCCYHNI